ncbi:hypothetical protein [Dysgonomonas sp. Marseille-P4361]|uniref:hypothetical protein n=1 Tax=Dysgonomonas sp. Marseille-P4361 TaxID=2161820 RepID=UPI000D559A42|nr:hypothetical protein [Dysgonomonas sp. Marseille-P4361]
MLNNTDINDDNPKTPLEEIKQDVLIYINRRARLFKLDAYEKGAISSSILGYGIIVISIVAVILFFSLIGAAFFIGELLDSLAAGFGILALFSLLVLTVVILSRKKIKRGILNKTVEFLRKVEANDAE